MKYAQGIGVVVRFYDRSLRAMAEAVAVEEAALFAGLVTHQDWRAGQSGEVVDGPRGPVPVCDVRAALDAAGVVYEYRPREVRLTYTGGNMRDGYGGATGYAGHMPGLLRVEVTRV